MPRILIVDDEPSIVLALKDELVFEGFEVDSVSDGRAALERAREFNPDVMLLLGVNPLVSIVVLPPLGTKVCGPVKKVGGVNVPNRTKLIGGAMPPPRKLDTGVNVCVSPPRLSSRRERPASMVTWSGENLHSAANL